MSTTEATTEIAITAVWKSHHTIEVPTEDADRIRDTIRAGGLPEEAADQIDASTAELTDWDLS